MNSNSCSRKNGDRNQVTYVNRSNKFVLMSKEYKQYFHLYSLRLSEMKNLLKNKVEKKWGSEITIKKLCNLGEQEEKCIIIGTIFKHQVLQSSALREIYEEMQLIPQAFSKADSDKIFLEDELQRIRLTGKINTNCLVTGVVCAVLGLMSSVGCDSKLAVEDILFYESGPQKPLKPLKISPWIILISSLNQSTTDDIQDSLEFFYQWLSGNESDLGENPNLDSSDVVRVIVAGNSVGASPPVKTKILQTRKAEVQDPCNSIELLDQLFSTWSKVVPIDVMPGEFDPSNYLLPQQPLHPVMFPRSAKQNNFKSVTNPYAFEIAERYIIGSSGQNIKNILDTPGISDPIEAMRLTLTWSHLSPSSPDTLPSFPFTNEDPFIIKECPNLYFTGNVSEFKTGIFKGENNKSCHLVCVPSFYQTQTVAAVNLNTFECRELSFKVNEMKE